MIKRIALKQLVLAVTGVRGDEKSHKLLFLLLISGITTPLYAETSDALDLLEKMAVAEQTLNYEGTVVYQHGDNSETMQIVHSFDQYGERERLSSLAGEPREMIRDDTHVFFIVPANRFVLVESRNIMAEGDVSPRLGSGGENASFYELHLNGTERIAGYSCQILGITPKDDFRYGYRLCIEGETGLLLKSQTLDGEGLPLEQMIYTQLRLPDSIPTESLQTTLHEEDFTLLSQSKETLSLQSKAPMGDNLEASRSNGIDYAWMLARKPPGFSVIRNEMRQLASSEQPVQHIIMDDGIASVSVFIEYLGKEASLRPVGVTRSGALSTFSKVQDNFMVTVIGEVPGPTVELIAHSLHYQPKENH